MLRDQIDVVIIVVVLTKLDLFKVRCGMQIYLCVHGFAVLKSHYQTIGFLSAERTHCHRRRPVLLQYNSDSNYIATLISGGLSLELRVLHEN